MKTCRQLIVYLIFLYTWNPIHIHAQNGDQILDGIGETDLNVRYLFSKDGKDWTRNNLHATIHGSNVHFVEDPVFEKIISLSKEDISYITIPGHAMTGLESVSITTWINLQSGTKGQILFDFGRDSLSHIYTIPSGTQFDDGIQVCIQTANNRVVAKGPSLKTNNWYHLAIVFDNTENFLCTYLNGVLVSEVKNLEMSLERLFDLSTGKNNQLFIGKSFDSNHPPLHAQLHDFRIYRIPLRGSQITRIYSNSLKLEEPVVRTRTEQQRNLPSFPPTTPQLYSTFLVNIPDINIETELQHLPRLPRLIPGEYKNQIQGPQVRVIWPAPEDNRQVLTPGEYTLKGKVAGSDLQPKAVIAVKESKPVTPTQVLEDFRLNDVILMPDQENKSTKLIQNRDKFLHVLAKTNPDQFLYMFRNAFGQAQPENAEPLGVWDSQLTKLRGHATGHYLTALAQAYQSTDYDASLQARFAEKMDYMVEVLFTLSQMSGHPQTSGGDYTKDPLNVPPGPGKTDFDSDLSEEGLRTDYWNWGVGYISAYPPDQFIMLENGAGYGTDPTKIWAPYYTLDKILTGLMDIYEANGNEKAIKIVKDMGDWIHSRLMRLSKRTLMSMWNTYIAGEYGGMNHTMARLCRLTHDIHYLETAKRFDNIRVFFGDALHSHGLAKNVDLIRGLHANQHIPQMLGALEIYRVSNESQYYHIADNFWYNVTHDYMYSIGGVAGASNPANAECFVNQPGTLYENGFSPGGQNETCATYNMLKLARELFLFNQRTELMDYYERAFYNHILASVAEHTPANTYHVSLRPGSIKQFSNPEMQGFTCCNGTAIESNTKLQNTIYFKSKDNPSLYINLFVPSVVTWKERDIKITQKTSFPNEDKIRFIVEGSGDFELNIRIPHWASRGVYLKINDEELKVDAVPGDYLPLRREWHGIETVELHLPFHFYLEPVMDQQNIASLFYGPILLAAQETGPLNDWRNLTFNREDISLSISGDPEQLHFSSNGIIFKPFYETYGRHSVYFNITLE
ncbi:MAG TPA: glycoside hydrolase family 127 protein [Saprospiraceae bacterium]|nr:glycoside hydrolase family 127 protein [Saprospiraceae bacterium]